MWNTFQEFQCVRVSTVYGVIAGESVSRVNEYGSVTLYRVAPLSLTYAR